MYRNTCCTMMCIAIRITKLLAWIQGGPQLCDRCDRTCLHGDPVWKCQKVQETAFLDTTQRKNRIIFTQTNPETDDWHRNRHSSNLGGQRLGAWRGCFEFRLTKAFFFFCLSICLSIRPQEHFWSVDKAETKLVPKLTIQIWDNDKFSFDDYLGKTKNSVCLCVCGLRSVTLISTKSYNKLHNHK